MSHQYTEELERVNQRIGKMEDYFKRLDQRLERIENAILGDDKFGQTGYKDRIERLENKNQSLEDEVYRLENKLKVKIAYFMGAGSGGGLVVWALMEFLI